MIRVACVCLWTCALFALTVARIYERCELARELMSLGVDHGDIATWVCIAFHESRFDTAANNPHSGDHGIFQISELYWCGPGKACGLPCSSLRNEDIKDDLQCALQIHEEHTRLQGNGFLAWVVYPQHCKQNTKKYVVDCDYQPKYNTAPLRSEIRSFPTFYDDIFQRNETRSINRYPESNTQLPPYLIISEIYRASYGKQMDYKKGKGDWKDYKIENIDELKLPVFEKESDVLTKSTISTTTSTTKYYPPVVPWRTLETDQFRPKAKQSTLANLKFSTVATTTPTTLRTYITSTTTRPTTAITAKYWTPITVSSQFQKSQGTTNTIGELGPFTNNGFLFSQPKTIQPTQKTFTTTVKPIFAVGSRFSPVSFISRNTDSTTFTFKTTTPKPILTFSSATARPESRFAYSQYSTLVPSTTKRSPTVKSKLTPSAVNKNGIISTTRAPVVKASTQSIFDLYLNPTTKAKLPSYDEYASLNSGKYNVKIFSGGTTTSSPFDLTARNHKSPDDGKSRNQIRRQILTQ
ncbi:uncharacterized protein LOC105842565 [Bombyx mori]|uniref:Lysozyme n=1 Tax=Bombyx mori TaxID=7091 RepID=D2KMR3_BOMMO|nr:uncharacterized protein LOC105842565 [Bombyx mori]ADA67927.1 putative lysozyme [Bombyx mori]